MKVPGKEKPFIFWKTDSEKAAEQKRAEEELAARGSDGLDELTQRVRETQTIGPFDRRLGSLGAMTQSAAMDAELPPRILDRDGMGNTVVRPVRLSPRAAATAKARLEELNAIYNDQSKSDRERKAAFDESTLIWESAGYIGEVSGSKNIEAEDHPINPGSTARGGFGDVFGRAPSPKGVFYRHDDPRRGQIIGGNENE